MGPVSRRLTEVGPILGVAAGRFGELSDTGQKLVLAEARVKKLNLARARGEEVEKGDLAQETSFMRRKLSQAIVIAFGRRLVSRMSQVGKNGQMAGGRRQQWNREEDESRNVREACWLERVQGRSIVQKGRFWRRGG